MPSALWSFHAPASLPCVALLVKNGLPSRLGRKLSRRPHGSGYREPPQTRVEARQRGPTGPDWSGAPVPSRAVWRRPAAFGVEQQRVSGPGVDKRCTARRRPARRPRSVVPLPACLPHCRSARPLLRGPYPRRLWEARRALPESVLQTRCGWNGERPRRRRTLVVRAGEHVAPAVRARRRRQQPPAAVSRRYRDAAGIPRSYRAAGRVPPFQFRAFQPEAGRWSAASGDRRLAYFTRPPDLAIAVRVVVVGGGCFAPCSRALFCAGGCVPARVRFGSHRAPLDGVVLAIAPKSCCVRRCGSCATRVTPSSSLVWSGNSMRSIIDIVIRASTRGDVREALDTAASEAGGYWVEGPEVRARSSRGAPAHFRTSSSCGSRHPL